MTRRKRRIVRAELGPDGVLRGAGGRAMRGRVDAAKIDAPAAWRPSKDAPVLTARQARGFRPAVVRRLDPAAVRRRLRLSQAAFARLFGFNLRTLQEWEQGRGAPDGPARALLQVIDRDPEAVRRALLAAE